MMVGGKLEQISSQLVTLPLSLLLKRGPAVPPQKSLYLLLKRQQGWRAVSHLSHHHHTYSRVSRCPISLSFEEEGEGPGGIMARYSSSNKEECERTWERSRSASKEERERTRSWSGRGYKSPKHCFETLHVSIPLNFAMR